MLSILPRKGTTTQAATMSAERPENQRRERESPQVRCPVKEYIALYTMVADAAAQATLATLRIQTPRPSHRLRHQAKVGIHAHRSAIRKSQNGARRSGKPR